MDRKSNNKNKKRRRRGREEDEEKREGIHTKFAIIVSHHVVVYLAFFYRY